MHIYETRRFVKALKKLSTEYLYLVENEIEKIIANPMIGEQKKGDLDFLRVHKFQLNNQQVLLGYSYIKNKIAIYLLSFSSHENFYQNQRKSRDADLKRINTK